MLIEFVFTLENGTHDSDDAHDEFGFSDWPDILLYESRRSQRSQRSQRNRRRERTQRSPEVETSLLKTLQFSPTVSPQLRK